MTMELHKLSYMPREQKRPWTLGAWVFVILCTLQLCTLERLSLIHSAIA